MDREISERIYKIKAICILCVIYAHMTSKNFTCGYIMRIIAVLAVPMFFFLSGYFYNYTRSLKEITRRTLEKICIPWWIWGTITYFFGICISSRSFLFKDLVLWIIGKGTWYYYLTVLIILYVIFKYLNSVKFCIICIIINFLSYISYAYEIFGEISFNLYLNIFNWCDFFSFGILVKKLNMLDKIIKICDKNKIKILLYINMYI